MTAGESESPSSQSHGGGSVSPPSSRSYRNGTKESTSRSRKQHEQVQAKIIQVANIAPQATRDQMQTLFGYIGKIDDLRLYPTMDLGMHITSKICFVKFYDGSHVGVAQHLTNTVFIDRALIIIPYVDAEIPDEQRALELLNSGTLLPGIADPKLPQHVTSQLEGLPPHQIVVTLDPKLTEYNLPQYPPLPPTYDTRKIEEIRRTVLIANIDSELKSEEVIDFFSRAGEVKYFRFCTRDNDPLHYALIEFTEQPSILDALKLNGTKLGSKRIKVYHSTQAIIKPQAKTNEAAQKEIEEAMSRQAQTILSQGIEAATTTTKEKRRSRSRSRSRRRSRSRSHRRSRSRSSRHRSSSRHRHSYRSKAKKSRSRSPRRSRSRSRDRRRHRSRRRSRSRGHHSRKSRSRTPTSHSKRSRSRSKKRDDKRKAKKVKKDKERNKSRERTKDKERDRSRERPPKDKERDRERDRDKKEEKERDRDRDKDRDRERNSDKDKHRDRDTDKVTEVEREKVRESSDGRDKYSSKEKQPDSDTDEHEYVREKDRDRGESVEYKENGVAT